MSDVNRLQEAAEWMLRLQAENSSDATIRSWIQWCEADTANQQAFDRVRELLHVTDGLAAEVENGELVGASPTAFDRVMSVPARAVRSAWSHPIRAIAATVAVAAIAATAWIGLTNTGHLPVRNGAVIASDQPLRSAMLPDGSRVEIAAKSTVAVHYTEATRALELQDGEAYFAVAPNKHRPFVVTAGAVSVRAVGTAFNVRRAGERVVVTITQGTVDVYREASQPVRAAAGSQVVWDSAANDPVVTAVQPATAIGWREGRLEYLDEPLEAVVADINRYAARPVVIADEAARQLRFSGTVMVDFTDEWLRALPRQFPLDLQQQNGVDVILIAKQAPAR